MEEEERLKRVLFYLVAVWESVRLEYKDSKTIVAQVESLVALMANAPRLVGKTCEDNSDCGTGKTCCDRAKGTGKCATSCIGKSCKKYGSHCATCEYCCSFSGTCGLNCIGQVCLSDNNCAPKETCCGLSDGNKGTCGRFCAGQSCKNDGHCGSSEYCCGANATCASKCAEQMSTRRHHCATGEFCCGNAPTYLRKCGKSCINISCR